MPNRGGGGRTQEHRQLWSCRHSPWPLQLPGHCATPHVGPPKPAGHTHTPATHSPSPLQSSAHSTGGCRSLHLGSAAGCAVRLWFTSRREYSQSTCTHAVRGGSARAVRNGCVPHVWVVWLVGDVCCAIHSEHCAATLSYPRAFNGDRSASENPKIRRTGDLREDSGGVAGAVCCDEGAHAGGLSESLAAGTSRSTRRAADPAACVNAARQEGVAASDTHQQQVDERPERVQARPHRALKHPPHRPQEVLTAHTPETLDGPLCLVKRCRNKRIPCRIPRFTVRTQVCRMLHFTVKPHLPQRRSTC